MGNLQLFGRLGSSVLLSFIVPAYNAEAYLARCLRSLLDQDVDATDYEIVVIDDGSSDGSRAIADSFALGHANVVVYSQENQGTSAARNAGVRLARGKYIWFVDADDHIASNVLAGLIALMDRERLQLLAVDYLSVRPDEAHTDLDTRVPAKVDVVAGLHYLASDSKYPNAVWLFIIEKRFLVGSGVRFEVGKLVEDVVFCANLIAAAKRMAVLSIPVYRYVQRPDSQQHAGGAAHTAVLVAGYEGVVFGLEELKERIVTNGAPPSGFVNNLVTNQQSFVFFMIARLIRSDVPLTPTLPDALARLRRIRMYPLTRFPDASHEGIQFRILTAIFNYEHLLYVFGRIVRLWYLARRFAPGYD